MENDLSVRIKLESFITEREGMIAENKQREALDQSIAYDEDAFGDLQKAILGLYNT